MEAAGIELLWSIWIYIQNPVWMKDVCCIWICFEQTVDVVDRSENSFGLVSWLKVGKSHLSGRTVQFVPKKAICCFIGSDLSTFYIPQYLYTTLWS